MNFLSIFLTLVFVPIFNQAENVKFDLGGQWKVIGKDSKVLDPILKLLDKAEYELNGCVPGGIYTDLMSNEIIGDIFYGYGDTDYRWVGSINWVYTRDFTVDQSLLDSNNINLVFEGLDTFATILLNGEQVGTSSNMFVRYVFPVKHFLKVNNTIEIQFESPVTKSAQIASESAYPVPPDCPPDAYRGTCHANKIRKMQASFSWDWGPSFPSVGIWKGVYLEAFDAATIEYVVAIPIDAGNDIWAVEVATYLTSDSLQNVQESLSIVLETNADAISEIVVIDQVADDDGQILVKHNLNVPKGNIDLWWPNGYGEQTMYTLQVVLVGNEASIKSKRLGFRTVELVQVPIGEGASFYFQVNGIPIFAKGANEIPLSVLPEIGQNKELIERVLHSAKDTNMNMIRVWGGGLYESDDFYDKTDELGIMVWQDFMFACALYPTTVEFLSSVSEEVRHQVKRLSSHPSIVLWAGNNENELALMTGWFAEDTDKNVTLYKNDYIELFIGTIKKEVENISPSLLYISSSPSNGKHAEEEDYLSTDPQSSLWGDVHYYDYSSNGFIADNYWIPRFASEYGFQSLPEADTWMTITDDFNDLVPETGIMDHRQHHPYGVEEMWRLIEFQFNRPSHLRLSFINQTIYYSQIIQAMSIKVETEHYRSFSGILNEGDDRGYTMGALFWQLNDVWVAPTWSGVDFTGRWKMLQYFAKDFFAPTIVTGKIHNDNLQIFVVSDASQPNLKGTVRLNVYKWNSFSPLLTVQAPLDVVSGQSTKIVDTDLNGILALCSDVITETCFFHFDVVNEDEIQITPANFLIPSPLKNCRIQPVNLQITNVMQIEPGSFEITVTSNGIALFVWLNSHDIAGRFSENGFLQLTGEKVIRFTTTTDTTAENLLQIITVTYVNQYLA